MIGKRTFWPGAALAVAIGVCLVSDVFAYHSISAPFAGVTSAGALKDLWIVSSTSWNAKVQSNTNPAYDIGTIGWTWWTFRDTCDGVIIDNWVNPGSVRYGASDHWDIGIDDRDDCNGTYLGWSMGTHDFQPQLKRQQFLDLATCNFIHRKRNVLICGPTGVGKTHLAQALAHHQACRQGFRVLFVNIYKMLQHLNGGRAEGIFERRMQTYLRPDLLVLDDFGLKPLHPPAPEDLYDVISGRYERGSILLTSNRDLTEWPELFNAPLLASAGLDRLTHNAHVVIVKGRSYRAHGAAKTHATQGGAQIGNA